VQDNIALNMLLEHTATGLQLLVTNVHLTWAPVYKDVKLMQTMFTVNEMSSILASRAGGAPVAVLLGGDFNSLPDSGVVEYLTRGKIAPTHSDFEGVNYTPLTNRLTLGHKLQLRNTCEEGVAFTNYTQDFRGTIDYVFYSAATITPLRHRAIPDAYLTQLHGCPNAHYPSDHLPLVAEYAIHPPRV
jgi:CCR4-NOT transcription complex subunit 6